MLMAQLFTILVTWRLQQSETGKWSRKEPPIIWGKEWLVNAPNQNYFHLDITERLFCLSSAKPMLNFWRATICNFLNSGIPQTWRGVNILNYLLRLLLRELFHCVTISPDKINLIHKSNIRQRIEYWYHIWFADLIYILSFIKKFKKGL